MTLSMVINYSLNNYYDFFFYSKIKICSDTFIS